MLDDEAAGGECDAWGRTVVADGRDSGDGADAQQLAHRDIDRVIIAVLSGVMCVGLLATGFGVYAEGKYYTQHQYNFVVAYPVLCIVLYGLMMLPHRGARRMLCDEMRKWRVYAPIGLMWSVNYAFILTANTYTSNILQVVFTETQLVTTFLLNKYMLRRAFSRAQTVLMVSVCLVNIIMIAADFDFVGTSVLWIVYWQVVYFLNGFAGQSASVLTEGYFKSMDGHANDDERHQLVQIQHGPRGLEELSREYAKTVVLNVVSNVYSVAGNLVFIYLVYPISGHNVTAADLFSSNLYDANSWSFYCMFLGTVVFTTASTILYRYTDVTYTTVVSNVANLLQVVLVAVIPGAPLHQDAPAWQYFVFAASTILVVVYAFHQPKHKNNDPEAPLIRYYKTLTSRDAQGVVHDDDARITRRVNLAIVLFFVLILLLTFPLAFVVQKD